MPASPDRPASLRLKRRKIADEQKLKGMIYKARQEIGQRILQASDDPRYAASRQRREQFFGRIPGVYQRLAAELDSWVRDNAGQVAIVWHGSALDDVRGLSGAVTSNVVQFDRQRIQRYWEMIHPDNRSKLAAVFTQQMGQSDIRYLRQAFIESFRQARLEGWTAQQLSKALQSRWDDLARNMMSNRFVDAAGRRWTNASYLQMLIRTTEARFARESYIDTLLASGFRVARVVGDGENCPVCEAWKGLILRLVQGDDLPYPSYQESLDAGMWHPNCDCHLEYVDELVDEADLKRQAAAATPALVRTVAETDGDYRRRITPLVQQYGSSIRAS